ncbi:YdcF family protein [Spirulina major]|uniref:YdcF family protein n=1 Tax=Spirulina major TaxID=270636 RepID=UPI000933D949|nr:YdcF family protein [Spirulina major]
MVLKLGLQRRSGAVHQSSQHRVSLWFLPLVVLALIVAYKQVRMIVAEPRAALVLGGLEARESYAAQLAHDDPGLEVWVSSGSPEAYVQGVFASAGVERDRLHLNYDAEDTVTNFTTLVDDLEAAGIKSIYLITSANHMHRARIIGEVVLGSRGIVIKPLPIEEGGIAQESWAKSMVDGGRAILWLFTGHTATELKEDLGQKLRSW